MMDYRIKDPGNFKKYLDSFKIIFVDLNTMDWELIKVERREKDASFEELVSLNENIEKENEFKLLVNKGKRFLFKKQNKDYLK
jgi:c-di-GMP-related signal transduction protein